MAKNKKKKFIKIPIYEGGNIEFRKFIDNNLIYPEEAIKNKIEGVVHLTYDVDDYGNVFNARIEKGIGYGCDEEALRLVKLQKFSKVYNQGMRVKISQKSKINFKLKQILNTSSTVNYSIVENTTPIPEPIKITYTYTYKI